jgi:hypothetical protein
MSTLMMRCYTEITVTQREKNGDKRNNVLLFDFVTEFEAESQWTDLTAKGKVTLPKNVYYVDKTTGQPVPLGGTNKLINTIFQRGDKVNIAYGYYTYTTDGVEQLTVNDVFEGYISKVGSKQPITLELEDNMWLLKQVPVPPQTIPANATLETVIANLIKPLGFTVNATTATNIASSIIVNGESVASLLSRFKREFYIESYFKGTELRMGFEVYLPSEASTEVVMQFQQNIISDELNYQRKDDIQLSAVAISKYYVTNGTNKQGDEKTKEQTLKILLYPDIHGNWQYVKQDGNKPLPENLEGERRTLNYFGVTDAKKLFDLALPKIQRYYYDGFKGKLTTFAIPLVQMGNQVKLVDNILPDRNGTYKIKKVKYSGGINGHRQEIELDYKLFA